MQFDETIRKLFKNIKFFIHTIYRMYEPFGSGLEKYELIDGPDMWRFPV
jgi:hypothetical protein